MDANVDVLDGNLFSCASTLPNLDPNKSVYECGWLSFEKSFLAWIGGLVFFSLAFAFAAKVLSKGLREQAGAITVRYGREFKHDDVDEKEKEAMAVGDADAEAAAMQSGHWEALPLRLFAERMVTLRHISLAITFLVLVILLPTYLVLDHYYRSQYVTTAWGATAGFKSGQAAAYIILGLLLLFLVMFLHMFSGRGHVESYSNKTESTKARVADEQNDKVMALCFLVVAIIDIVIVLGSDVLYVFYKDHLTGRPAVVMRLALSLVKICVAALYIIVAMLYEECGSHGCANSLKYLCHYLMAVLYVNKEEDEKGALEAVGFLEREFVSEIGATFFILCSFGVAFPPLTVMACARVWADTYMAQLAIAYTMEKLPPGGDLMDKYKGAIMEKGIGVSESFEETMRVMAPFTSIFFAFFVFDSLGDDVGIDRAFWLLIFLTALPVVYTVFEFTKCKWGVAAPKSMKFHQDKRKGVAQSPSKSVLSFLTTTARKSTAGVLEEIRKGREASAAMRYKIAHVGVGFTHGAGAAKVVPVDGTGAGAEDQRKAHVGQHSKDAKPENEAKAEDSIQLPKQDISLSQLEVVTQPLPEHVCDPKAE